MYEIAGVLLDTAFSDCDQSQSVVQILKPGTHMHIHTEHCDLGILLCMHNNGK